MFARRTEWRLAPNRFTQVQRELASSGRPIIDLTLSNPTRAALFFDDESILASLAAPEALDYDPQAKGLLSARKAVCEYYREQHEVFDLSPESLILTTSTSEAYAYIFRLLCNVEDEILVPKPSYPLFEFLADLQDVKLVPYPLIYDHGWQIDLPSLYQSVNHRTRAVVVVHPNNPTGSFVSAKEIAALNAFCREYSLAIIADEVFLDYAHDGAPRPSFMGNQEVLTFTLSGLSKISGLPQMKVAWLGASGPLDIVTAATERLEVIADTFLSMNAPSQLATPALLQQRKNIQPLILDRVRSNREELDSALAKQQSCGRLAIDGGWYAVLRVPVTRSDEDLAIELLQKCSVAVHPGHFFDFPQDGYLVVSLLTPQQDFREGTRRVLEMLNP
ncbi:MAG TPA: pyridoxal phosphate-dependent aminotransferase [Terriglobales bacterium]|nr:pyridoxal phosphate-dependent aminotransferase [Terriglobales bacterium]